MDDLVVQLEASEHLTPEEAEAFDYACGVARADAVDGVLMRTLEDRGLDLFAPDIPDRVVVEHAGPSRARIVIDGAPATPWWNDRVRIAGGKRTWSFEPQDGDAVDEPPPPSTPPR